MLDVEEKNDLKRLIKDNKKFHYMITDRYRQDVEYYIRIKSKENAINAFNEVSFLLSLFNKKDIPEWYTLDDLKKDKEKINQL